MKFFSRLINPEKRNANVGYIPPTNLQYTNLYATYNNMNISAAYRCAELISDSIASMPIQVKKINSKGTSALLPNNALNLLFDNGIDDNLSKFNLIKMIIQSVILKGNGFCYIERLDDGTPLKLRFLQSGDVLINYNKERDELYYNIPILHKSKVNKEDVLHFVKNSYDGVNGVSLLSYAKRSLELSNETENAAGEYFKKGGNLNGIIGVNAPMTANQREQLLNDWNNSYKSGNIAVLPVNMSYHQIQMNSKDAQLLESRQYNCEDVCRFFGVNPTLLGLQGHSSYSSLEMLQQDFLLHTLMPYIIMIEDELKRKLCKKNIKIILDTNSILRTNKAAQAQYYTSLLNSGVLSINEVRQDLGYSAIENGDNHQIPYSDLSQNTIENNNSTETQDDGEKEYTITK